MPTGTTTRCSTPAPQRAELNQGIWLDLEEKTEKWADKYGSVWVVCRPVVYGRKPLNWLGQSNLGEVVIAIPDAFFKIAVREPQAEPASRSSLRSSIRKWGVGYKDKNPTTCHT
jgi:DNA/RNA endonuclease G (NUC1)